MTSSTPEPATTTGPSRRDALPGRAPIEHDHAARCAAVLADAFALDPWATYVLGAPPATRRPALTAIMKVTVVLAAARGGLATAASDRDDPAAVSAWVPSGHLAVGPRDLLRARSLALPVTAGPRTVRRLVRDEADQGAILARHLAPGDAYLWVLGVRRSAHGTGLGRDVVEQTCAQARARGLNRVVLNTDNPANVEVYRRLGFRLIQERIRSSGLTGHVLARALS